MQGTLINGITPGFSNLTDLPSTALSIADLSSSQSWRTGLEFL